MKHQLLILLFLFSSHSFSQVRTYYSTRTFPPLDHSSNQHSTDLVEITGVSVSFAKAKIDSYLKKNLKYDRIGHVANSLNDSVVIVTERFKSENDPEINPKFDFIEFKYKTRLIEKDTVVEYLDVSGSEAMIGEFYRSYWNQELNLIGKENAKVISDSENENDCVQLIHDPNSNLKSNYSAYSISVVPIDGDFEAVLASTQKFLAERNQKERDFNALRAQKAYHMQEIDLEYYNQMKHDISIKLRTLLGYEKNITGKVDVLLRSDTLGQTWVSVSGKNARINQILREKLVDIKYRNQTLYGFKMTTEDTYHFDYEFVNEDVSLLKKPSGVIIHSKNIKELENVARKEASSYNIDKAEMIYSVSICNVNGNSMSFANITSVERKTTAAKGVGAFFAGLIGVIVLIANSDEA